MRWNFLIVLGLIASSASCKPKQTIAESNTLDATEATTVDTETFQQFPSPVPHVTEAMQYASFWSKQLPDATALIATLENIQAYNQRNFAFDGTPLRDIFAMKSTYGRDELVKMIQGVSKVPEGNKYKNGELITEAYKKELQASLHLDAIAQETDVRYGIAVRRSPMKNFPTDDEIYNSTTDYALDRFMETTAYPLEPMVIFSTSRDGRWYFAQMYNYAAWIKAEDVALTDKETLKSYVQTEPFLIVTGKKATTHFNPFTKELSEYAIPMGVRVPLARRDEIQATVDGQGIFGNFVVKLPVRNAAGQLEIKQSLISRSEDASVGYLPYTRENILKQAFKLLGTRYGWGGRFHGNDCSSTVMDVHTVFGFKLPRNSGELGHKTVGKAYPLTTDMNLQKRLEILATAPVGSALEMPGHIMIYVGQANGQHYILHAHLGLSTSTQGALKTYVSQQVALTPVTILTESGSTYMEKVRIVREFDPI